MALPDPHTAWPVTGIDVGDEVEGEADDEPVTGAPFRCFLQFRDSSETRPGRQVKRPLLLFEPVDSEGIQFSLRADQELLIEASELFEGKQRFQVDGDPTPLAPPGELIGYEAALRRVEE